MKSEQLRFCCDFDCVFYEGVTFSAGRCCDTVCLAVQKKCRDIKRKRLLLCRLKMSPCISVTETQERQHTSIVLYCSPGWCSSSPRQETRGRNSRCLFIKWWAQGFHPPPIPSSSPCNNQPEQYCLSESKKRQTSKGPFTQRQIFLENALSGEKNKTKQKTRLYKAELKKKIQLEMIEIGVVPMPGLV